MPKPFLTYTQQIEKLKYEKNLIIDDVDYATDMLKQIGYFKLIGGYKHLLRIKPQKNSRIIRILRILYSFICLMRLYENLI